MECYFRNYTILWQLLKSTNVSHKLLRKLSPFQIYIFLIFLPPLCRSRSRSGIFAITPFDGKCQNLQMSHTNFCASSNRLRDVKILKF